MPKGKKDNLQENESQKRNMWLVKTDQGYFESVVASGAIARGKVHQYIKPNTAVSDNYKKGDYVILWYNRLQKVSAYYTIDDIRKTEPEAWNAKIIEFDGTYHKLQLVDYASAEDDVILVFDLIHTVAKGQAHVARLDKGHEGTLTVDDVNSEDSVGMAVKIVYNLYSHCVTGNNLRFFKHPFNLGGYSSQEYRFYKQIDNQKHVQMIAAAQDDSWSLVEHQKLDLQDPEKRRKSRSKEGKGESKRKRAENKAKGEENKTKGGENKATGEEDKTKGGENKPREEKSKTKGEENKTKREENKAKEEKNRKGEENKAKGGENKAKEEKSKTKGEDNKAREEKSKTKGEENKTKGEENKAKEDGNKTKREENKTKGESITKDEENKTRERKIKGGGSETKTKESKTKREEGKTKEKKTTTNESKSKGEKGGEKMTSPEKEEGKKVKENSPEKEEGNKDKENSEEGGVEDKKKKGEAIEEEKRSEKIVAEEKRLEGGESQDEKRIEEVEEREGRELQEEKRVEEEEESEGLDHSGIIEVQNTRQITNRDDVDISIEIAGDDVDISMELSGGDLPMSETEQLTDTQGSQDMHHALDIADTQATQATQATQDMQATQDRQVASEEEDSQPTQDAQATQDTTVDMHSTQAAQEQDMQDAKTTQQAPAAQDAQDVQTVTHSDDDVQFLSASEPTKRKAGRRKTRKSSTKESKSAQKQHDNLVHIADDESKPTPSTTSKSSKSKSKSKSKSPPQPNFSSLKSVFSPTPKSGDSEAKSDEIAPASPRSGSPEFSRDISSPTPEPAHAKRKAAKETNDAESENTAKRARTRLSVSGTLTLRKGEYAAVRGESRSIWVAKIREDYEIDKSNSKWHNTLIDVVWLIETKEYEGRYILIEDKEEWQAKVEVGSIVKTDVRVVRDSGGLWAVVGGVSALKKLL